VSGNAGEGETGGRRRCVWPVCSACAVDEFRCAAATTTTKTAAVAAFRRKSCSGDQSLMSATITEADTDDDGDCTVHIATDRAALLSTASPAPPAASPANKYTQPVFLGQLSLASLRGRLIEYQLRLG